MNMEQNLWLFSILQRLTHLAHWVEKLEGFGPDVNRSIKPIVYLLTSFDVLKKISKKSVIIYLMEEFSSCSLL